MRREVEARVRPHCRTELAHDRRRAHPSSHHVADDQGGTAAAEGDDVVPVAADGRLGAAGVVGGGDAQVVGLLQLLREQGALEGDGGLALPALAGAQPLGGLGMVGDVGGEDQHPAAVALSGRGAGERVRAAVRGLARLDRPGSAAAQDLVEEGQQAQFVELRERSSGGRAGGADAEGGRVGVVEVGDAVVRAVQQGDEAGDAVQDLAYPELVDGRHRPVPVGEPLRAGRGHGALSPPVRGCRVLGPRCGAALRSGEPGAPAREVHESLPRVVVGGRIPEPAGAGGRTGAGPPVRGGGPVWQGPAGPTPARRRSGPRSSWVRSGRPLRVVRWIVGRLSTGRQFELRPRMFE